MVEFGCQKYKETISFLQSQVIDKDRKISAKDQMIEAWKIDYAEIKHAKNIDISLLRLKLTKALESAIKIPDISEFVLEKTRYNPWVDQRLYDYQTKIADRYYYTYSEFQWQEILALCWKEVEKAQDRWLSEVGDCDNWAEAMHYVVTNATLRANPRPTHQSAICIAWSSSHAYNLYFSDEEIWVYEPQNGEVKGVLGETEEPYDTRLLLFIS